MKRTTKKIDTTLHYFLYIGARIIVVAVVAVLIYSIIVRKVDTIIFCSLFLIYSFFLLKRVFDKPAEISYDKNFIYLGNGTKPVEFKSITLVKRNKIFYELEGMELKIKLPNFHFMDKNWKELKELINEIKH